MEFLLLVLIVTSMIFIFIFIIMIGIISVFLIIGGQRDDNRSIEALERLEKYHNDLQNK